MTSKKENFDVESVFFKHPLPRSPKDSLISSTHEQDRVERGTICDFFSFGKIDDSFSIDLIKRYTHKEILGHRKEVRENLQEFSYVFERAKSFLENELGLILPSCIRHFTIKSIDDIVTIFENASRFRKFRKSEQETLGFGPMWCAILKIAYPIHEIRRTDFEPYKNDRDFLFNKIFCDDLGIIRSENGEVDITGSICDSQFRVYGRIKEKVRIIMKMLQKPQVTLSSVKDGIGFRVETSSKHAIQNLIIYFFQKISRDLHGEQAMLCNNQCLDDYHLWEIGQIANIDINNNNNYNNFNPHSGENFENVSLRIHIPNKKKHLKTSRFIEIQFVLTGNSNDSGWNNHHIYELKQCLSVITRLFGYFHHGYLRKMIYKTQQFVPHFTADDIEKHLLQSSIIEFAYNCYGSRFQLDRLSQTEFLPSAIKELLVKKQLSTDELTALRQQIHQRFSSFSET